MDDKYGLYVGIRDKSLRFVFLFRKVQSYISQMLSALCERARTPGTHICKFLSCVCYAVCVRHKFIFFFFSSLILGL